MLESVDREPVGRFKLNILDACLVGSIYFALDKKVTCEEMYKMNKYIINNNFFYKKGLRKKSSVYSIEGRNKLKEAAKLSMKQDNPYDWKYEIIDGKTINEYTCNYYTCGIKYIFEKWDIKESHHHYANATMIWPIYKVLIFIEKVHYLMVINVAIVTINL